MRCLCYFGKTLARCLCYFSAVFVLCWCGFGAVFVLFRCDLGAVFVLFWRGVCAVFHIHRTYTAQIPEKESAGSLGKPHRYKADEPVSSSWPYVHAKLFYGCL